MKSLLVLGVIFSILLFLPISAEAKSWYVYIDKMPENWKADYGHLFKEAKKFWENRILGLKFYETTNREKADFVVQWASQYQGTLLGYYTPSTNNEYGKPYIAITLGYMDDESVPFQKRKFNLVHPDYALEITKHEIGHAIGLGHSIDPNNIMYESIYNYDLWLSMRDFEESSKIIKFTMPSETISFSDVDKKRVNYENKIEELKSGISSAENSLSSVNFESKDAQKKIESAWNVRWTAKEHLMTAEKAFGAGLYEMNKNEYKKAIQYFSKIDQESENVGTNLVTISILIDEAQKLEDEFQAKKEQSSGEVKQEKKICFLFWCW